MYVRLKHTFSALALEAMRPPARNVARSAVALLVAFCDLVKQQDATDEPAGFDALVSAVQSRARRTGTNAAGLRRVLDAGLLTRNDGHLSLPEDYRPHFAYMNRQVHRLAAAIRALDRASRGGGGRDERATILTGVVMFNAGLFFECHEFLEGAWRVAPPADRGFHHGIILIAAAFYHYEKGNLHGARIKLTQGIKALQPYLPHAHGVRLDQWMAALDPWRNLIEAGQLRGVLNPSEIPRIPMTRARAAS